MSAKQDEEYDEYREGMTLEEILRFRPRKKVRPKLRKLKLICVGGEIVGEATVIVSPCDPNYWHKGKETNGEIEIRRR